MATTLTKKEYKAQWYLINLDRIKIKREKYYQDNKEKIKARVSQYKKENHEIINAQNRKWRKDNPEKVRLALIVKYRTNPKYNINHKMKSAIAIALKKKKAGRKWKSFVDYTIKELETRLKNTIPNGYTWQDFLEGKLHIDHIIPKSAFNYDNPEHIDFKRCWALGNLQLLTAGENHKKSNKLFNPFQPALKLGK